MLRQNRTTRHGGAILEMTANGPSTGTLYVTVPGPFENLCIAFRLARPSR